MNGNKDRRLRTAIASPRLFGEKIKENEFKQEKLDSRKLSDARAPIVVSKTKFSRKSINSNTNVMKPRHEAWAHSNSSMFTFEPRELEEYQLPRKTARPGRSLRRVSNQTEIFPEPPSPRVGYIRQPLSPNRASCDKTGN